MQVFVRDNNVDQALRVLKKKMQREGLFRNAARKLARKKAQRDGLIPDARKKKLLDGKKEGQRPGYRPLRPPSKPLETGDLSRR